MSQGMIGQVLETIEKHKMLRPGDVVLVAFSGGPDSLTLLHLLKELQGELGITLQAAHLDHGLRGAESAAEAQWAAQLCGQWQIPCTLGFWDGQNQIPQGMSVEQGARQARLKFLLETQQKVGATAIAQGHHGDDQAETLLIRLLSGAGMRGLGGIRPVWRPFIRPLLAVSRRQILAYCQTHHLEPRLDSSNASNDYLRNQLRHQLVPLMQQYNPQLTRTLCRTAELLQSEDQYLDSLANRHLRQISVKLTNQSSEEAQCLSLTGLNQLEPVLARRALRLWLGREVDCGSIQRILNLAAEGKPGGQAALSGGWTVVRDYTVLQLIKKTTEAIRQGTGLAPKASLVQPLPQRQLNLEFPLLLPQRQAVLGAVWLADQPGQSGEPKAGDCPGKAHCRLWQQIKKEPQGQRAYCCLPWDLQAGLPTVRSRQPGDWVSFPFGHKKLKDWFIDGKIPIEQRNQALVLAWEQQVLWVPGLLQGLSPFAANPAGCLWLELRKR